ncbi:MAG: carbohydrate ABC transporter permease [Streptosporangiaceae bacterium]|nr:carbohydrate ABC transporter permease [Streptosporangiaceae bacterium]
MSVSNLVVRSSLAVRSRGRYLLGAFLILAGFLMLLPVIWVVLQSFEVPADQSAVPPVWFPHRFTLGSYRTLFATPFLVDMLNSVAITAAVIGGAAVVSVLAAYAFARLEFRGRELLFTLFLAALTLPSQVAAVPEFVVVKYLKLLDTRASLVIPALIQVLAIFLLRQHIRTIPRDLDDAARIDGAGHLRIIRHIIVPMSWPAISAVMVITGQYIWNDFFWPNLFITTQDKMTAPLALYNLESVSGGGPIGAVFAGLSLLCIPCVIAFVFLQRRLMEGIGYRGISR